MSFKSLSESHQKAFAATNEKLGLGSDEATHGAVDHPKDKTVVYSTDPLLSDVPPKLITVNSIEDWKKMTGFDVGESSEDPVTHDHSDLKVQALSVSSSTAQAKSLNLSKSDYTAEDKTMLRKAAQEYVTGGASTMKDLVPHINSALFPIEAAVFSSSDTKVGPVSIESPDGKPVVWNYPTVEMGPAGKINVMTDFVMNTSTLESRVGAGGDLPINNTPAPYTTDATAGQTSPPPSIAGGGSSGTQAASTSKGCPIVCTLQPGDGHPGEKGPDGGDGNPGSPGGTMSAVTITINEALTGQIMISASGGNGQNGGAGATGTAGGAGGPAGFQPTTCSPANVGTQGAGGAGGVGGNGGDGGAVGAIIIKIPATMAQPTVNITSAGGKGGNNGASAQGGAGKPSGQPGNANTYIPKPSPAPAVVFQRLPPT
jgi:hypothetical protein